MFNRDNVRKKRSESTFLPASVLGRRSLLNRFLEGDVFDKGGLYDWHKEPGIK
jgi:hypothetical protein